MQHSGYSSAQETEEIVLWQLGVFTLNSQQLTLLKDNIEQNIEPKAVALLAYLSQKPGQYITINELIEQVWHGRFVSDAAVRGTIRKLRGALGDTAETPQYIQSSPGRGYRLLLQPTPIVNTKLSSSAVEQILHSPRPIAKTLNNSKRSIIARSVIAGTIITILLISIWLFNKAPEAELMPFQIAELENITSFPSEKYALDISIDQRFVAFSARTDSASGYQLFLLDRKLNQVLQLTEDANNITEIKFINDDQDLAYVDLSFKDSKLSILRNVASAPTSLSEENIVLSGYRSISALERTSNTDEVYAALGHAQAPMAVLHKINLLSGSLLPLTSAAKASEFDYLASLSPDQTQLAIVRRTSDDEIKLSIILPGTHSTKLAVRLNINPQSLQWLANSAVLLLTTEEGLYLFDTTTQSLVKNSQEQRYIRVATRNGQHFYGIGEQINQSANYFKESALNSAAAITSSRIFEFDSSVEDMFYISETEFLLLQHTPAGKVLAGYKQGEPLRTFEFNGIDTFNTLQILARHHTDKRFLANINGQLALIAPLDKELTFITSPAAQISGGSFTLQGDGILYTEKIAGNWYIMRYNYRDSTTQQLLSNFYALTPLQQHYIGFSTDEKVLLLNEQFAVISEIAIDNMQTVLDPIQRTMQITIASTSLTPNAELPLPISLTSPTLPQLSPDAKKIIASEKAPRFQSIFSFSVD